MIIGREKISIEVNERMSIVPTKNYRNEREQITKVCFKEVMRN